VRILPCSHKDSRRPSETLEPDRIAPGERTAAILEELRAAADGASGVLSPFSIRGPLGLPHVLNMSGRNGADQDSFDHVRGRVAVDATSDRSASD
jgi:hypothetical protein